MALPQAADVDQPVPADPIPQEPGEFARRAMTIWPRLDRRRLRRVRDDPMKIAHLVAQRTTLSVETIAVMIVGGRGAATAVVRAAVSRKAKVVPIRGKD